MRLLTADHDTAEEPRLHQAGSLPDPFVLLAATHVTKRFGSFVALDDVSFAVRPGIMVGVLGPNGAGKTTLLSILTGLIPPSSGRVTLAGTSFALVPAGAKHLFGFVPDSQDVLSYLTGWEYLDFLRRIYRLSPKEWAAVDDYLSLFRMDAKIHDLLETYSHGQRKKVQMIAALLHRPSVLILDEPLSGLDPEMAAISKSLLQQLRDKGVGILLSTHDLLAAEGLCDQVLFLNHGQVLAMGSTRDLLIAYRSKTLEDAFLKAIDVDRGTEDLQRVLANF